MSERPLVAVRWARHDSGPLIATCSECGDLTGIGQERHALQRVAWWHAEKVHDGDVDRSGWA